MQITHKTVLALLVVFLALLAGAALTLDRAVRPGFEQLEHTERERGRARANANLASLADEVERRAGDYANWDDTYSFAAGRNPTYVNDLSNAWFDDYGIDLAIFSDASGRVLWGRRRSATGDIIADPAMSDMLVGQANARRGAAIWLDGLGFVMISARSILRSDGTGPSRGWVIMGTRISEASLREQTQLHIELIPANAVPAALAQRFAMLVERPSQTWADNSANYALSALHDLNGQVDGAVFTTQAREIKALGDRSIAIALGMFAAVTIAALAALWWVLRGLFIRRIERLERHFDAQGATPSPMPLQTGQPDEITRLTAAYNGLVARLLETTQREQDALIQREVAASANRMKSDFLANISHELRAPLDAVIGYAEMVGEELAEKGLDHLRSDLDRISEAARQQLALVGEILDLSKIEAGKLEIRPETFKLHEMIESAVNTVAPQAKRRNSAIQLALGEGLGAVYSDQKRLRQCLVSVLSHACRRAPGGTITLIASRLGDTLRFEIHDTGAPMSAAQLARAFEPFVESKPTIDRRLGEARLGLAITRKLLGLLGGAIEASGTEDAGARFVLTAPALLEETPAYASAA